MFKARQLTDEENFYFDFAVTAKKTTLELYDRLFASLITISGILLSVNTLANSLYIFTFLAAWLSLLFSIIGIFPKGKMILPNFINEMRSFIEERIRFKKITFYISISFLFLSFALSLLNKLQG